MNKMFTQSITTKTPTVLTLGALSMLITGTGASAVAEYRFTRGGEGLPAMKIRTQRTELRFDVESVKFLKKKERSNECKHRNPYTVEYTISGLEYEIKDDNVSQKDAFSRIDDPAQRKKEAACRKARRIQRKINQRFVRQKNFTLELNLEQKSTKDIKQLENVGTNVDDKTFDLLENDNIKLDILADAGLNNIFNIQYSGESGTITIEYKTARIRVFGGEAYADKDPRPKKVKEIDAASIPHSNIDQTQTKEAWKDQTGYVDPTVMADLNKGSHARREAESLRKKYEKDVQRKHDAARQDRIAQKQACATEKNQKLIQESRGLQEYPNTDLTHEAQVVVKAMNDLIVAGERLQNTDPEAPAPAPRSLDRVKSQNDGVRSPAASTPRKPGGRDSASATGGSSRCRRLIARLIKAERR